MMNSQALRKAEVEEGNCWQKVAGRSLRIQKKAAPKPTDENTIIDRKESCVSNNCIARQNWKVKTNAALLEPLGGGGKAQIALPPSTHNESKQRPIGAF